MSEVQTIFNKVINAGHYNNQIDLMCWALDDAKFAKIISIQEYRVAKEEIRKYLGAFGSLSGFLAFKLHDHDFSTRFAIYKDWENRPYK